MLHALITLTLILGSLLFGAPAAAAAPCAPGNVLQDGGLEQTNPNTSPISNPFWTSTSTNFGTSICNLATCGNDVGKASPRTGSFWAWFGGFDQSETGTLSQTVTIPGGVDATLRFYLRIGSTSEPLTDVLQVKVDGNVVHTFPEPGERESGYTLRSINLDAFADGGSHAISFEYHHVQSPSDPLPSASDFTIDDISLDVTCPVVGSSCPVGDEPSASLLLPYFEVGLADSNSPNTILSIGNTAADAVLAHLVVWSDLSVHVLDFNIYLTGYDVQNINLGGLLAGSAAPITASAAQDPADALSPKGAFSQDVAFPGCTGLLPITPLPSIYKQHVQAALTGKPSSVFGGKCAGQAFGDNVMRGYVTIDTVRQCTTAAPGDPGYFAPGGTGIVTNQNVLFGTATYVNKALGKATGEPLVHVRADASNPQTSVPGQYTFYGRYVDWSAADNRTPLASTFAARFAQGGGAGAVVGPQYFTQGTSLVVWRDSKVKTSQADDPGTFTCPAQFGRPSWYPMGQEQLVIFDDQEHPVVQSVVPFSPQPPASGLNPFPAETQKVKVGSSALPVPFGQGWMYLDLNTFVAANEVPPEDPAAAQAWVSTVFDNASPAWRVTARATRLDSVCDAVHPVQ